MPKASKQAPDPKRLPPLDPLEQYRQAAQLAQDGNKKLTDSVDVLRTGLEMLVVAEFDNETQRPLAPSDYRRIATEILDQFTAVSGTNWRLRRNRIIESHVGDRSIPGGDYSSAGHGASDE